jgi:hypothetical protein
MRTIRIALFALLVLLLGACAAPQPYMGGNNGGGYSYRAGAFPMPPEPVIPAGWANAYTPYMGLHGGRCYFHGFVQPTNDACLNGTIQTPVQSGQTASVSQLSGAQARPLSGMSPETARLLLDELNRRDNPCTAKGRTISTSIGAFIGGIAAAIISRGDERVVAVGALIGAAGGNSEAVMSCQAYTDTRVSLILVLDQYGCSGQVRKTNGVVTDDEICDYRRPYTPGHAAPQIADRNAARSTPAPAAAADRPAARPVPQQGRPSWLKPGEELPPK